MANPNYFEQAINSCTNTIDASAKFLDDTFKHPENRTRQAGAVAEGLLIGGMKAVPDRFINHTEETVKQIGTGIAIGAAIALAPVEIPAVATGLAIAGTAMTCAYVWDVGQRLGHNTELHKALDKVWETGDASELKKTTPVIESSLGIESFNLGLAALTTAHGLKLGGSLKQLASAHGSQFRPCLQTAAVGGNGSMPISRETLSIANRTEPYYAMSALEPAPPSWAGKTAKIDGSVSKLSEKSPTELIKHTEQISEIAHDLLQISKSAESISGKTAESLIATNKKFNELLKPIQNDIRSNSKAYDQDLLSEGEVELFDSKRNLLTEVIQKRMKELGFDQPKSQHASSNSFSKQEGLQVQARVSDCISKVINPEYVRPEHADAGQSFRNSLHPERRLDWRGLPTNPGSSADMVGADYIIANKSSGELYAIDVTLQAGNLRAGALVDSQGLNKNILWTKKDLPMERRDWTIGAVDNTNYFTRLRGDDFDGLKHQELLQVAKLLGNMLSTESPLNIIAEQLPISSITQHPTLELFELLRFRRALEDQNMPEWSNAVKKSMESVLKRNRDSIPTSWQKLIFSDSNNR